MLDESLANVRKQNLVETVELYKVILTPRVVKSLRERHRGLDLREAVASEDVVRREGRDTFLFRYVCRASGMSSL